MWAPLPRVCLRACVRLRPGPRPRAANCQEAGPKRSPRAQKRAPRAPGARPVASERKHWREMMHPTGGACKGDGAGREALAGAPPIAGGRCAVPDGERPLAPAPRCPAGGVVPNQRRRAISTGEHAFHALSWCQGAWCTRGTPAAAAAAAAADAASAAAAPPAPPAAARPGGGDGGGGRVRGGEALWCGAPPRLRRTRRAPRQRGLGRPPGRGGRRRLRRRRGERGAAGRARPRAPPPRAARGGPGA